MKKYSDLNTRKTFAKFSYRGPVTQVSPSTGILPGALCLFSRAYGRLYAEELEAARKTMRRAVRKGGGLLRMRVYATCSYTKKPLQARMGKGKGRIQGTFSFVRPGQILFELSGIATIKAMSALSSGASKLSLKTIAAPFGSFFL